MFKKILVANRGEIAVRVLRACREMGIASVTVYSDADQTALHTLYADEVYHIGEAPASESYLCIEKIIDVAKRSGAEAVHPGYGFLAENTGFARACEEAGIAFIGPTSRAIELLGDKIASKRTMTKAHIPIIPGSEGPVCDEAQAIKIAQGIGFPVLIKAAGGGGGKGMRIVRSREEMPGAMKQATSEARSAFGDPTIFIEKFLEAPRHVEFQILADTHGNVVHLFERECSVQRRHQKLIEESPSAIMTHELRQEMGEAAVKAVKASDYTNAGTVEFMVDKNKKFYFLEMNTRLQVEHPVTELITGIDIVREQLKIAAGEKLTLNQKDIKMTGSAIECRISAEDPENNFAPSTGMIVRYSTPGGIGVRVDDGVYEGFTVPIHYDPLIAKLLVWAPTRQDAIARMKRALREYTIHGIKTSIPFHTVVMNNERFVTGNYDTTFIDTVLGTVAYQKKHHTAAAVAAVLASVMREQGAVATTKSAKIADNPWKMAGRRSMMRRK
ncbi:acetyl-CoA carboxylase biotin carboxylase subunit [candidate division WOR-3 bacterium]|nr:acetyl-CoA carboxylase biotin carboxylase subunit [candidate division WOR-3 bacterium]